MGIISTLIGNRKAMFAVMTVVLLVGVYYLGSVTVKPFMTPQQFDNRVENGTIKDSELVAVTGTLMKIDTPPGSGGSWYKLIGSNISLWSASPYEGNPFFIQKLDYELQLVKATGEGDYRTGFTYAWILSVGSLAKQTYW